MVSLTFFFFFFILVFAIIGAMRGWAREMLVSFSVVLAVFIISILETLVPSLLESLTRTGTQAYFWLRAVLLMFLVFFGYQTPNLPKIGGNRFARERLEDSLLGFFLGGLNGFLIVGSLWYYMELADYPFKDFILRPDPNNEFTRSAIRMLPWLAPMWLKGTTLYIAIALAFVFVIVVFL